MVKITRVYTGGGDEGESSLVDGSRRMKSDARFEVVGTCDELNSWLGMILMEIERLPDHEDGGERTNVQRVQTVLREAIGRLQHELFDLGAELACPPEELPEYMALLGQHQADVLVDEMDAWLASLPDLTSFILPAGSGPIASIHLARTVARRLERNIVTLSQSEGDGSVRPLAMVYVNRISDWLFVLGRWTGNMLNEQETLWLPLGKRPSENGVAHRYSSNASQR